MSNNIHDVITRLKKIAKEDEGMNPEFSWSNEVYITYARTVAAADDEAENITTIVTSGKLDDGRGFMAGFESCSPAPLSCVVYPLEDDMPESAQGWVPPSQNEIANLVRNSIWTQRELAARAGLSLDRLERIIGNRGGAVAPARFGEMLALLRVA